MKKSFKLTENHIKLLQRAYVSWEYCETGAPSIDCKRPYGNSYVPGDIHKILTGTEEEFELTDEQENEYLNLHTETETALQIILHTKSFVPGTYQAEEYDINWKLIK